MHPDSGWIEVICGSMYSGKTEELIRRLRLSKIARKKVVVFKPATDSRYSKEDIVSHNERSISSIVTRNSAEIVDLAGDADVIGIDEVQFFDMGIISVCQQLARKSRRVIVAGLDMDFRGDPFGPMPSLLATAEFVTKSQAICMVCGNPANFSQRKILDESQVLLGAQEVYEARCRRCFTVPQEEQLPLFRDDEN
jgi:thymidine kinase